MFGSAHLDDYEFCGVRLFLLGSLSPALQALNPRRLSESPIRNRNSPTITYPSRSKDVCFNFALNSYNGKEYDHSLKTIGLWAQAMKEVTTMGLE